MYSYYARQPIFNLKNDTIAYELLYRDSLESTSYSFFNGDLASASVINTALFGGDPKIVFGGKKVYINFTEKLLTNGIAYLLPPENIVIEVLEDVRPTPEVITALDNLYRSGYKIALDDYVENEENSVFLNYAYMVKIDFRVSKEEIERTAKLCRERRIFILAEKVETQEDIDYAKSLGAVFFQGYFYAKPIVVSSNNLTPLQTTFMRLASKLSDPDTSLRDVSDIIQTDAAMTLRFLRLVNFIRFDWMDKIQSVHQAVLIAGINKTKEFIYFNGLSQLNDTGNDEIILTGFYRADFCWQLARIISNDKLFYDEMYLTGLMSIVIDYAFSGSDDVIEGLPFSENIKSGLKLEDTPSGEILRAVIAYDKGRWEEVEDFRKAHSISHDEMARLSLECIEHSNHVIKGFSFEE
ncbi:MAG: HDOD domain-containing protein [Ruminococcus sp.]|nr:HDOD domain-containing protein [Ruminococcus sp.]